MQPSCPALWGCRVSGLRCLWSEGPALISWDEAEIKHAIKTSVKV